MGANTCSSHRPLRHQPLRNEPPQSSVAQNDEHALVPLSLRAGRAVPGPTPADAFAGLGVSGPESLQLKRRAARCVQSHWTEPGAHRHGLSLHFAKEETEAQEEKGACRTGSGGVGTRAQAADPRPGLFPLPSAPPSYGRPGVGAGKDICSSAGGT